MGVPKKADWREERRKRAWQLREEGWQQKDIAVALGVSEGAVSHWIKRGREGGEEALKAHPPKGVSPRLTAEQQAQIPTLLAKGAAAYGCARRCLDCESGGRGDQTDGSRVRYHRDHVGKLMREAGWSRVIPVERASQRNDEAIKKWSDERWPEIKKADQEKATIIWVDEAGFSLLPMAVRTWAPRVNFGIPWAESVSLCW